MILKVTGFMSFFPLIAILIFSSRLFYRLWHHGPTAVNPLDITGLGASFLFWGLWFILFFGLMKTFGTTTTGKVIGFQSNGDAKAFNSLSKALPEQNAIIEFMDAEGKAHQFSSPYSVSTVTLIGNRLTKKQSLNVGDPMEVIFDPENPNRAIENRLAMQLFSVLFFILGAALIGVGLKLR